LNQIQEQHASADIAFGDADNQSEIRFTKTFFCFLVALLHTLGKLNFLVRGQQRHLADFLKIHAHRIVNRDSLWNGGFQIDFFRLVHDHVGILCNIDIILQ